MTETTIQYIEFCKVIWLAIFSLLYGLGGISGKWRRRYLGSGFLTLGFLLFSYIYAELSYWYFLCFPLYVIAFSKGYGENSQLMRLTKSRLLTRLIYGFMIALCCLPVVIVKGHWLMFGLHIFVCMVVVGILGSQNPIKARSEETSIAVASGFLPLFMI